MNSEIVYQVVKALPLEEQKLLLDKLKKDFTLSNFESTNKIKTLTEEDAINYLLKNTFSNRKQ